MLHTITNRTCLGGMTLNTAELKKSYLCIYIAMVNKHQDFLVPILVQKARWCQHYHRTFYLLNNLLNGVLTNFKGND